MNETARIAALEAENERLRDRVEFLERNFGVTDFLAPVEWRLTASETRVFGHLLARDLATKDSLMAALYCAGADDEPDIKIVDVFVCKLRKKIKPFGLEIDTLWGQGYRLSAAMKAHAKSLLGAGAESVEVAA